MSNNGDRYRRPILNRDVELRASVKSECITRPMTAEEKWYYGVAEDTPTPPPSDQGGDDMAYRKYPHVTKEFVQAEFAKNKTAAQIEREQDMPANSLYARLKSWGIRSPHSVDFKKSEQTKLVNRESPPDAPAPPSSSLDDEAHKLTRLMDLAKELAIHGHRICGNQEDFYFVLQLILFARKGGASYASANGGRVHGEAGTS